MTQKIFDTDNAEDMALLWSILPDDVIKLTPSKAFNYFYGWYNDCGNTTINMLKIDWHDKTEIVRPIQEATEADIGKICMFWDYDDDYRIVGILKEILKKDMGRYRTDYTTIWNHCRRLTKQEIEELC